MVRTFSILFCCILFLFTIVVDCSAELSCDELLRILKEKGVVTDQDIEQAKGLRIEKQRAFEEKKEVVVKASRLPKSVNFKGRVQARYSYIEDDNFTKGTSQNAFDQSEFEGFVIRRVRLQWFGEVVDRWKYHIQISVDGDHNTDKLDITEPDYELRKDEVGVKLQDAYFIYDRHPLFNLTVGQFKSRFSPSYLTSGPALPLCERPLVIDKLTRKREIGFSIESKKKGQLDGRGHGARMHDNPIFYAVGLYNGNGFNKLRNDNDNFMATAMVVWRPSPYINFGVSYAYDHLGYDSENTVLGKAKVDENSNYVFEVKDGAVGKRMNIWDINSALDAGPVHLQVEYVQQHGHGFSRAYGYGVQGQIDLTDTFQLTARYDEFDPDVKVDDSFDSRWYTLGCNWFLHGQSIKWQFNYTFREEMNGGDVDNDVFMMHFQLLF